MPCLTDESKCWETLHIKLLNKIKYRARPDRWEPVLGRFLLENGQHEEQLCEASDALYSTTTASHVQSLKQEEERLLGGYYGLAGLTRARVLLCLFQSQFDRNQRFKEKVNLWAANDLRYRPLGWDVWGRAYWLLKDTELNVLLYRTGAENEAFQVRSQCVSVCVRCFCDHRFRSRLPENDSFRGMNEE